MPATTRDEQFMQRAIALARRGCGRVEPNPMVGCVIVKHGHVIGEGYHRRFGGPHAEVFALRRAGAAARGADAYVTLEPCCHFGKTPPCTEALIAAGVARLVAAILDPSSRINGRGVRQLRRAGIAVEVGAGRDAALQLAAPYLKHRRTGRPWVILKWAQSLDGKIADRDGKSQWISSPPARRLTHRWRGEVDAVIVGSETALKDNPLLTARDVRPKRIAVRVVLDGRLRLPPNSKLAKTAKDVPLLVATSRSALQRRAARRKQLEKCGAEIVTLPLRNKRLDVARLLDVLGKRDMQNVLVEGGGALLGAFYERKLADECRVFVSPRLIGGVGAPSALGGIGLPLPERLDVVERRVGDDRLHICRLDTAT